MPKPRPARLPIAVAGLLLAAAPAVQAQSTLPAGGEFRVNQYTTGNQQQPAISVGPDGNYLVVWESQFQDGSGFGIFGRRFSRKGVALGPEFQVNQATVLDQTQPDVAVDGAGRYTVVWTNNTAGGEIVARQFTNAGPAGGEFLVNDASNRRRMYPRVTAGPDGMVVVWESREGFEASVHGRLFSQDGVPISPETPLSTDAGNQTLPVVASLPNQRFVVAWRQSSSYYSAPFIRTRLFDRRLQPVNAGTQIPVPLTMTYRDHVNVVSMGLGTYSVGFWEAYQQTGKDYAAGWDYGVQVVDHGVDGTPLEPHAHVAAGDMGDDVRYEDALAANGNQQLLMAYTSTVGVLFCWDHFGPYPCPIVPPEDGSGASVFLRSLGPGANPVPFRVNTFTFSDQSDPAVALDATGNSMVVWQSSGQDGSANGIYAQRVGGLFPAALAVDAGGNGMIELGEPVVVAPSWVNESGAAITPTATVTTLTGPAGGTYTLLDGQGGYGTVGDGTTRACTDCYAVRVDGPRPAAHVDAVMTEVMGPGQLGLRKPWSLHVVGSFTDVPAQSPYFRSVETLLHRGVTGGCTASTFCPGAATTREQMAVFLLTAREGTGYRPAPCTGTFNDVPATSPFCGWVEELARRGVTGGCGGGNFCAAAPVTREQMSVFVLRTLDPTLNPPACTTPMFDDVPASSAFCRWVEEMARRGITGGCGGRNFCPTAAVTREQMAVFLTTTFGLTLYGV